LNVEDTCHYLPLPAITCHYLPLPAIIFVTLPTDAFNIIMIRFMSKHGMVPLPQNGSLQNAEF
jgi:hypothetical protein